MTEQQEQAVQELDSIANTHMAGGTMLSANARVIKAMLTQTQSAMEQAQRERDEAQALAEECRLRLPTTVQAMVYQSLLSKYEALEKQRDERLESKWVAKGPDQPTLISKLLADILAQGLTNSTPIIQTTNTNAYLMESPK